MTQNQPHLPQVTVQLVGEDGNAFAIVGKVQKAMRDAGVDSELIQQYQDEAFAGDYDNLLYVTQQWVYVE